MRACTHAHTARTGCDRRRVALTMLSATWQIRPLYNEWSSLREREAQREYHEPSCIPRDETRLRRARARARSAIPISAINARGVARVSAKRLIKIQGKPVGRERAEDR